MTNEAANRWIRTAAAITLPLALSACLAPTAQVDARSPMAARTAAVSAERGGAYPKFSAIPAMPTDVRPARAWADSVAGVKAAGVKLTAETAPDTFSLNDTEAFAARARAAVAPAGDAPGEAAALAQADEFARIARARATPPPSKR